MGFAAILKQEIAWFDCTENSTESLNSRLSSLDEVDIQGVSTKWPPTTPWAKSRI